jgi:hypothetical protein
MQGLKIKLPMTAGKVAVILRMKSYGQTKREGPGDGGFPGSFVNWRQVTGAGAMYRLVIP